MNREPALKIVVDRIEGDTAVLVLHDNEKVKFHLPVECLPEGTRGGDHLRAVFTQDIESREAERNRAERLLEDLKRSQDSKAGKQRCR